MPVPLLGGVSDIRSLDEHLEEHQALLVAVLLVLGLVHCARGIGGGVGAALEVADVGEVVLEGGGEHEGYHVRPHALIRRLVERSQQVGRLVARPAAGGGGPAAAIVAEHDGEGETDVVVLEHGAVVVAHGERAGGLYEEGVVHAGVREVVNHGCQHHRAYLVGARLRAQEVVVHGGRGVHHVARMHLRVVGQVAVFVDHARDEGLERTFGDAENVRERCRAHRGVHGCGDCHEGPHAHLGAPRPEMRHVKIPVVE
mmetsp:Transcript_28312/g.76258  ORF Transcript_28312/g.76258 Transcript_28312/m.76258 type:complete len:256 (-) Transcript_28312:994-1761(-)